MRKVLLLLVVAVLLAGCSKNDVQISPKRGVAVDTPALRAQKAQAQIPTCTPGNATAAKDAMPDHTLACLGGGPAVNLAKLRGPLVINVWASWCGPCRAELPRYAAFAKKYAGKVAVVGVDFQDVQPAAALQLAADSKVNYPLVADPDNAMRVHLLPQLVLVDAQGKVTYKEAVEITSLAQLEQLVAKHLGVSS